MYIIYDSALIPNKMEAKKAFSDSDPSLVNSIYIWFPSDFIGVDKSEIPVSDDQNNISSLGLP